MTDFSYPGVSSYTDIPIGSYVDNRPTSGLNLTPRRRQPLNSPTSANGRNTPRKEYAPLRRDSQEAAQTPQREVSTFEEVVPVPAPTLVVPTPEEAISPEKWFERELYHRMLLSGLWTGTATYLVLVAAFLSLHITFWSPLKSISDVIRAIFSFRVHGVSFIASVVNAAASFFVASLMARVDQQKRASLARMETWISFCLSVAFYVVVFSVGHYLFLDMSLVTNTSVFTFLFCFGTALCSAVNVFSHDYQLLFGGLKLKNNFKNTAVSLVGTNISLCAHQSVQQGIKVLACTSIAAICLVPIFFGFSGWLFFFNLSGHLALIVTFSAQILIGHVFHRIIRQKILEPVKFPFPPPYAIAYPSGEQKRNISAVLQSSDTLLKLFAMFDLRHIAWFDSVRRSDAYALSQPAGNAKNWKSICTPCLEILDNVNTKIEQARKKAAGIDESKTEDSDEEEYINRNMLMMPPSARGQMYSARTRNRHQSALKPPKPPVQSATPTLSERISKWTLLPEETGLLTRLETEMIVLAIEALDMFTISSFGDDRYGVVQQDLTQIVRSFLNLHTTIDRYLRIKGFSPIETGNDSLMRGVEDVLVSAVTRISERFSTYIKSLGLNNNEWRQFEGIISQSSIHT